MQDTDILTDLEVFAATLIGEAESLGEQGMEEVACVILNRSKANLPWMGGCNVRQICLQPFQFSCWNNSPDNADRKRILSIATSATVYAPFVLATRIAGDALAGRLADCTNNAVSYFDPRYCYPRWAKGQAVCYMNGDVWFFNLAAIT